MQFFGRLSMSIYLIHKPLIFYIRFFIHTVWNWDGISAEDHGGPHPPPSPLWMVPIHIILSPSFGILITIFIEEPARKRLKEWKEQSDNKRRVEVETSKRTVLVPK